MNPPKEKISKFLSYVLRHKPESIQLPLDNNGWASIATLIDHAKPQFILTHDMIEEVVRDSDKQRFALSDDKTMIRANQGHSINIDLQLEEATPPSILYHGTATRFLDSIHQEGLVSKRRHHVHLSSDIETATSVGSRHGKVVILTIDAGHMHSQGYPFYLSKNGVWLTEHVPMTYITI